MNVRCAVLRGWILSRRKKADPRVINFAATDFDNERYDAITFISLIEHLVDPLQAMEKCLMLLNPGGVLLMKTVNYDCVYRRIKKGNWTGFRPPDHIVYFVPHNWKRLLEKVGFGKIVISASPFNDNMYCDAWK